MRFVNRSHQPAWTLSLQFPCKSVILCALALAAFLGSGATAEEVVRVSGSLESGSSSRLPSPRLSGVFPNDSIFLRRPQNAPVPPLPSPLLTFNLRPPARPCILARLPSQASGLRSRCRPREYSRGIAGCDLSSEAGVAPECLCSSSRICLCQLPSPSCSAASPS